MFLCLESFGLVASGGGGGEKSLAIQKIAPKTMFSEDYQIELGLARNPYRQEGLWLRNAFEPFASGIDYGVKHFKTPQQAAEQLGVMLHDTGLINLSFFYYDADGNLKTSDSTFQAAELQKDYDRQLLEEGLQDVTNCLTDLGYILSEHSYDAEDSVYSNKNLKIAGMSRIETALRENEDEDENPVLQVYKNTLQALSKNLEVLKQRMEADLSVNSQTTVGAAVKKLKGASSVLTGAVGNVWSYFTGNSKTVSSTVINANDSDE